MKLFVLLLAAAALPAQQRTSALTAEIARVGAGPAWVEWTEPMVPGHHGDMCDRGSETVLHLEGPTELLVLVRIENSRVDRIRVASPDCRIDSGGVPLHRLTGILASESVSWLRAQNLDSALLAISLHADASALPTLIDAARNDPSPKIRKQSLFWLAQRAADKTIVAAVSNDPDRSVREQAVFALYQLPKNQGTPLLIGVAKNNADPAVRKRAMFWLGQSNDPRALDFIATVLK